MANKKACVRSPAWQALHPQTGALWGCILFSAQRLSGRKLLVGKAGRAVCHMDDTAAGKAVLFQQMLHDLEIEYNRVRQAAITQEITEVCAGAKSLKKE